MEGISSSLATLELYVNELFSGTASKEQIQKIHHALDKFSRQKGAWKDALFFLDQTTNPQTAMYSLTVLEGFITKGWSHMTSAEHFELRSSLYQWILAKHQYAPYFIRNKAIQLIVYISRTDWPEKYPDFFADILALISSPSTSSTILGLLFLQTTSEELGTPKDNLLYSRRIELKQRLLEHVPQTLAILTGLLQNILLKRSHTLTSTPPPSPTNPLPPGSSTAHAELSSNPHSLLNQEEEPVARLVLQCLTHIFSWIPLSNHVTPELMELIFRFVGMGTNQTLPLMTTSNELSVPVVALGTVNEILYKNCVPVEFEDFVILLFNNCCIILHQLVNSNLNSHLPHQPCPQFMEKLIELVHLLISNHLRRLEGRHLPQFSVAQFLSLFFSFTFEQTDWNRYASCLDTWQVFLGHIKESKQNLNQSSTQAPFNGESLAFRYQDSLVTLSEHVLRKSLFANNGLQLEELDDEATDGNMETERQRMLLQSFEVFVMAGELVRNQTLSLLSGPFQRCTSAYQSLVSHSEGSNGVVRLDSEAQLKEILIAMKDLATLVQLIGRLSELHTGPDFCDHFEVGKSLVLKLIDLGSCGKTVSSLKFVGVPSGELLSTLFLVHAQILSSLHAWCHWISIWAHGDGPKEQVNSLVSALIALMIDVFSPTWSSSTATSGRETDVDKVYQSGLQLLSSVVTVIRISDLWSDPLWNQIYHSVHEINYLPIKVHRELMRLVLGSTVITWRNCTSDKQHWEDRQHRLHSAIGQATNTSRAVVEAIRREPSNQLLVQAKPAVISTVSLLADLAGLVREESIASKVALSSTISMWVEPTLLLLSCYINDSEVTEAIFQFYVAVFDSLLNQVGISIAEKAIQTFLETFNQQNIQATLQQNDVHGVRTVEQLLRILQIVVQEPGNAFKRFLPNTLSFCLEHVYPCIGQVTSSDLKETFYRLLTLILHHHWRWFFKGSVLTTLGSRELDRAEQVENQSQFIAIMTSYGQSFLLPDIAIFKQNLEALETLNSKWKLYHKAIFRDGIANQFINTLLNVLTEGSHELLREEIGLAIYAMASPDLESFFQHLLPNYLLHCQGIEDHQKLALKSSFSNDLDLPSFTQNVYRLTNDLRYFRSTNISNANLYQC